MKAVILTTSGRKNLNHHPLELSNAQDLLFSTSPKTSVHRAGESPNDPAIRHE